jgi:hypothetical protein
MRGNDEDQLRSHHRLAALRCVYLLNHRKMHLLHSLLEITGAVITFVTPYIFYFLCQIGKRAFREKIPEIALSDALHSPTLSFHVNPRTPLAFSSPASAWLSFCTSSGRGAAATVPRAGLIADLASDFCPDVCDVPIDTSYRGSFEWLEHQNCAEHAEISIEYQWETQV